MLDALWPSRCVGCAEVGRAPFCSSCRNDLELRVVEVQSGDLDGAVAASLYATSVGRAVRAAKYGPDRARMRWLARAYASVIGPWAAGAFDGVVPVPSPWPRRIRRGFAPATLLATALARAAKVPVRTALRARPGPRQARLDMVQRWENPRQRLRARGRCPGRVLLVDDVITTGATTTAAARLLREAGARQVWVAALCAAELRHPKTGTDT